jgi:hypothetical protein
MKNLWFNTLRGKFVLLLCQLQSSLSLMFAELILGIYLAIWRKRGTSLAQGKLNTQMGTGLTGQLGLVIGKLPVLITINEYR